MADKKVQTTLVQDKVCKSCVRFRSENSDEGVTTSLYLVNESYEKLGEPKVINVIVTTK